MARRPPACRAECEAALAANCRPGHGCSRWQAATQPGSGHLNAAAAAFAALQKKSKKREEPESDAAAAGQQAGEQPAAAAEQGAPKPAAPADPLALDNFPLSEPVKSLLRAKSIQTLFAIQAQCLGPLLEGKDLVGRARWVLGKGAPV